MQSTEQNLSEMLGVYLRSRTTNAKHLAREIGCDQRTAEGFRAGRHWPQAKHWLGLVGAFGREITDFIFHPEQAVSRLEREVADLERQLAEREAQLRLVSGEVGSSPRQQKPTRKASSHHENGTAALTAARKKQRAAA